MRLRTSPADGGTTRKRVIPNVPYPFLWIAVLIIVLLEIGPFNLPFWSTLRMPQSASQTQSAARTTTRIGKGLEHNGDGVLLIDDPTQAYIEIDGLDAPVSTVRWLPGEASEKDALLQGEKHPFLNTLHLRLDTRTGSGADAVWHTGTEQAMHRWTDVTAYLRNHTDDGGGRVSAIRLWVQETTGAQFAFDSVAINVPVPFRIDWLRVGVMAVVAVMLFVLRPRSRLYRVTLNTASRRQRIIFAVACIPLAVYLGHTIWKAMWQGPQVFHQPYNYVYDFDQYARVADSLLHGRPWLDLPVPWQLAEAADPYDVNTRNQLLSQGVGDIYWDHVFFNGHWYSYFGVVPAVLVFLPYQLVTSLWVPGGAWLPASVAAALFSVGFVVFGSLLVIRLFARNFPHTSVGMTVLALIAFLTGSDIWFLCLRGTFYEVPLTAALMMATLGLWLWLGARRTWDETRGRWRMWTADDVWLDGEDGRQDPAAAPHPTRIRLSLPHIAFGSLCVAATLGCRATFIAVALLFLPIFADEIRSGLVLGFVRPLLPHRWRSRMFEAEDCRSGSAGGGSGAKTDGPTAAPIRPFASWRRDLAALLPAFAVFAALLSYNFWRFGSFLDFGNDKQLTVTDLNQYREPLDVLGQIVSYYLFIPPRLIDRFPWLAVPSTPLNSWQYHERLLCGFLWFAPICLLLLALPWMRRTLGRHRMWGMACTLLGLGVLELTFVSYKGGMDWRYVGDFAWLFVFATILIMPSLGEWAATRRFMPATHGVPTVLGTRTTMTILIALTLLTLAMTVACTFMTGKIAPLRASDPTAYYTVESWFSWL
ncbi:hypothetical protein [Bifidobacterium simiarum]|uniref:hypothetical protein n=1 Tax=Bifidobacterium simiarum TaxID=2045441 RepID=UPI001BDC8F0B|nr:hypothetical protein [Bifidobacterium simiarum]MBT1165830.1 hypothetical protein [Bifidobacterium simiarum]